MKKAVLLFNLGGPENLEQVEGFLFNLFSDKNIITLPNPLRYLIAKLISSRRKKYSQYIYESIGGKSPILDITKQQAEKLEERLGSNYKSFVAMRYTAPRVEEALKSIKDWGADEIILLPLYPHFSTTTTGSSLEEFANEYKKAKITIPYKSLCCYFGDQNLIKLQQNLLLEKVSGLNKEKTKIIFSAHSLPQKIIDAGDPYKWQHQQMVAGIMEHEDLKGFDHILAFQSKVGPVPWLKPETESEIRESQGKYENLVILPISFVSDHSETLYELDIQYQELAEDLGIKNFLRVSSLNDNPQFIEILANYCLTIDKNNVENKLTLFSINKNRLCPAAYCKCINQNY